MKELIPHIFLLLVELALLAMSFFAISLVLRKPKSDTGPTRNFTYADTPYLVNRDFKCEIFYPFINVFITGPLTGLFVMWALADGFKTFPHQALSGYIASFPLAIQVLAGLLVIDISLYIRHRFVHTYFWPFHAIHHCAQTISWLTTKRLHPVDQFVMGVLDFVVMYFIGFSGESMVIASVIKRANNLFVHSNIVLDYPKPLKYIFVSPNMHRWHHATEPEAYNKNYCVVFAFIDLAMGTYHVPDNALPKSYGVNYKELNNIADKNILKELYYPFAICWRKFRGFVREKSGKPLRSRT